MEVEDMLALLQNYKQAREENIAPENPDLEALLAAMDGDNSLKKSINVLSSNNEHIEDHYEEIFPSPFFVVKTTNEKSQKVLVNFCGSDKISAPGNWEEGIPQDVEEAINEEHNESSAMHVHLPLSCSEPIISSDKNGRICWVYDLVYNESVIRQAISHKRLKVFLIEMALTWIGQKSKTQLNFGFKLPHLKYKGTNVRRHYIRAIPKPLVTELPDLQPSFPLLASSTLNSLKHKSKYSACGYSSKALDAADPFIPPPDTTDKKLASNCKPDFEPLNMPSCLSSTSSFNSVYLSQSPDALVLPSLQPSIISEGTGVTTECSIGLCDSHAGSSSIKSLPASSASAVDHPSACSCAPSTCEPASMAGLGTFNKPKSNPTSDFGGNGRSSFIAVDEERTSEKNDLKVSTKVTTRNDLMPNCDLPTQGPVIKINYNRFPVDDIIVYIYFTPSSNSEYLSVCATSSKIFLEGDIYNFAEVPLLFCTIPSEIDAILHEQESTLVLKLPVIPYCAAYLGSTDGTYLL